MAQRSLNAMTQMQMATADETNGSQSWKMLAGG